MDTSLILWGAFGGLLPDIIRLVKNRFAGEFADFYRSPAYWTGFHWFESNMFYINN